MVSSDIEFLASVAGQDAIRVAQAHAWHQDAAQGAKALYRLEQAGLLLPIARGDYAVPDRSLLADALAGGSRPRRLAAWLPAWLAEPHHRDHLPAGLEWHDARFLSLAVERRTDLAWDGPHLLVPIDPDASHMTGLHHRVPILAYDSTDDPATVDASEGHPAKVPSDSELARILGIHNDPRLVGAARQLLGTAPDPERIEALLARTGPPAPFPDPKTHLPRGPPFRYRVFAPRTWVQRNLEHQRPAPLSAGARTS